MYWRGGFGLSLGSEALGEVEVEVKVKGEVEVEVEKEKPAGLHQLAFEYYGFRILLFIPPYPGIEVVRALPGDRLLNIGAVHGNFRVGIGQPSYKIAFDSFTGEGVGTQGRKTGPSEIGKSLRPVHKG